MDWLEQEPTTKNNLGVDAVSRDAVKYYIQAHIHEIITESGIDKNAHTNAILRALLNGVDTMPSVTPQLSSELEKNSKELEKDFGELDCISRADARSLIVDIDIKHHTFGMYRKVFKDLYNGIDELPPVTPQEPFKPMVEIDLYSVIKQKYIEREVLDKIRAEIEQLPTTKCTETRRIYIDADDFKKNVLEILDKYKAEGSKEA